MIKAHEAGKSMGHDTTMCGDPKVWFPMRVTYSREMKMKEELERLGIECFVPMTYKLIEVGNGEEKELRRKLMPAINNLIFVHSTRERMSELKMRNEALEPLRYMIDHTVGREHEIMTVPERQMENFLRVASKTDESVIFLDESSFIGKEGKRVQIMGGPFEGVEGVIRRVKRCKRVVIEIEGVMSVAIAHVPVEWLKEK